MAQEASGSVAKAQANLLSEIPGWDFDATRTAADLAADIMKGGELVFEMCARP